MCVILNFVEIKKDFGKCSMVFADGLVLNMSHTFSNYMCTYLSEIYICVDIGSCWYRCNSCCIKLILLKQTLQTTVVQIIHRISIVLFICHSSISNFSPNVNVYHMSIKHSQGHVQSNSHRGHNEKKSCGNVEYYIWVKLCPLFEACIGISCEIWVDDRYCQFCYWSLCTSSHG